LRHERHVMDMQKKNKGNNEIKYSLGCVYRNGKLYRTGISVNDTVTDVFAWEGQLVASLMSTLDLKDYFQTIKQTPPEKLHEKTKELAYSLLKLCKLMDLDINQFSRKEIVDYLIRIQHFAIWAYNLINAKTHGLEYFEADLTGITMKCSSVKENETLVTYSSKNIFQLAQIEFAEHYKSGKPYIVCQKCGTIYFTYKVKTAKTCPFCKCPSLEKDRRAIDRQADRLYKNNDLMAFKEKFIKYLITKRGYSEEEALKEYDRQLKKKKKGRY
jgi:predicted Zn-ribbon and HTH transcriptional regulator